METPYSETADLQARFPSCTVTTNPKKRKKVIAQAVAFFICRKSITPFVRWISLHLCYNTVNYRR